MARPSPSQGSLALANAGTIAATAAILDVDTRTVSAWRSGSKRPSPSMQTRIRERLGIQESSWLVNALAPTHAALGDTASIDATRVNLEPARGAASEDGDTTEQTAIERLREQIARLKVARAVPGLSDRTRVDYERVELGASRELARLEGRDVTFAQVIGSPHFARFQADLLAALNSRPWALALCLATFNPMHAEYVERWRADYPAEVEAVETAEAQLLRALEAAKINRHVDAERPAPSCDR